MDKIEKTYIDKNEWEALRQFTAARIALGVTGVSVPLKSALALRLAHAHAREAVYSVLDMPFLTTTLHAKKIKTIEVCSCATDRNEYLQRPDFGRKLSDYSAQILQQQNVLPADIVVVIADGLSASAVNKHAVTVAFLVTQLAKQKGLSFAPVVLASQARVAITDEIGYLLNARLSVILIGERPGLSASDSMGAYITYNPKPGNTDEKRNCVSNIRPEGLPPEAAAEKIMLLIEAAFKLQLTGVALKDEGDEMSIVNSEW